MDGRNRDDKATRWLHGRNLQCMRNHAGLSQSQLAERIGWTIANISNLETGIRDAAAIRVETAEQVAAALGIDIDEYARRIIDTSSCTSPWPTIPTVDGTSLTARRKELGLTRKQAAELSGIGVNTLYQWEHGIVDVRTVELRRIIALARTLRLTLPDLLRAARPEHEK